MARFGAMVLIFLVVFSIFVSNTEASRKLLTESSTVAEVNDKESNNKGVSSVFNSLFLGALPKGTVPPSSPSNKGHASVNSLDNEKLFQRHLASIDRILGSVPSPGVGH